MSLGSQFLVAVCDDVKNDREEIAALTTEYYKTEKIDCSVRTYESGEALLKAIKSGKRDRRKFCVIDKV